MNNDFRKFDRKLRSNGYKVDHVTGSHYIYRNRNGNLISVNKAPNKMVMKRLAKENNLR